jgi:hypothetical protein
MPNEVESVKVIGNLHGDEVKLIKTTGGFWVAVGKKKKSSRKAEALAAGSHSGIVNYQVSKQHGEDFQPAIFKSEHEQLEEVENKSDCLSKSLIDTGIELYILSKNSNLEFVLYKHGLTVGKYDTEAKNGSLLIKNYSFNTNFFPNLKEEAAQSVAKAMENKMKELNLDKVEKMFL